MVKKKRKLPIWLGIIILVVGFTAIVLTFTERGRGLISVVTGLLFEQKIALPQVEKQNDINILLLGIGGGNHEGPNLTDTIIFVNIDPEKNNINLFSLPRDIWSPDLQAKINTAYAFGQEREGKGILLAQNVIETIVGKSVDYTIVVDFNGFIQLVDLLGGIEVDVQRTFDDYYYPIPGKENELCGKTEEEATELIATASSEFDIFPCRYQHIRFDKGKQQMDGKTALLYVRSRHASGPEGSDFARSKRQSQVIKAAKDKVLSLGTIFNPVKVVGIYDVLEGNINTNIKTEEFDDFIKLAQKMQSAEINHYVIDAGDSSTKRFGLLESPDTFEEYRGQWVLIPRTGDGNFDEIHGYVNCIVEEYICEVTEDKVVTITPPSSKNK